MNAETLNKIRLEAEREVIEIAEAWPTAKVRWSLDGLAAMAIIGGDTFTYMIEVDGSITRSLWVSHRVPIGPDSEHVPEWSDGWVD